MIESAESPQHIREILEDLGKKQQHYSYDDRERALYDKTLAALIGPTKIGKTTIANAILSLDSDFSLVNTTTTRARRPDDPLSFKTADEGVTFAQLQKDINAQKIVNYSVNKNGHVYATYPGDFPGEFNVGPILPDNIDNLSGAGFRNFMAVFVVARGAVYAERLKRELVGYPDALERIAEGKDSLNFAKLNVDAPWLGFVESKDEEGGVEEAARNVVLMSRRQSLSILTIDHRLQLIDEMNGALDQAAKLAA